MDFTAALPTFVVTLREGVEAALVVGIVLACLNKAKQNQLNSWVYSGVVVGILASVLVGILFGSLMQALAHSNQPYAVVIEPLLEGVFCLVAIAMLSWMLIWMTQQARLLKTNVEGAIAEALTQQTGVRAGWGVFTLIFIAVLREGFETVLFITAQFQAGWMPILGAVSGLAIAAFIGVLLFKWGIKINLRLFFQSMGVFLLLIVAGLVVSALKDVDQAVAALAQINQSYQNLCWYSGNVTQNLSCTLGPLVWNTSKILPDKQFPGIVLKALFGYREKLYLVQAIAYVVFLVTVGGLYFRSLTDRSSTSRPPNLNPNA